MTLVSVKSRVCHVDECPSEKICTSRTKDRKGHERKAESGHLQVALDTLLGVIGTRLERVRGV